MFAFQDCTNLEKVTFNSETSNSGRELLISTCAFCKCFKLKNVVFPKNISNLTIDKQVFDSCFKLDFDRIPSNVTCKHEAFRSCALTNVTIEGDAELEKGAFFASFSHLSDVDGKIEFKKNVTMSNSYSEGTLVGPLAGNSRLKEIVFRGETKLCERAFCNDESLEKISWGNGIKADCNSTTMGENVFQGCDKLKTFEFLDCGKETVVDFLGSFSNLPKLATKNAPTNAPTPEHAII